VSIQTRRHDTLSGLELSSALVKSVIAVAVGAGGGLPDRLRCGLLFAALQPSSDDLLGGNVMSVMTAPTETVDLIVLRNDVRGGGPNVFVVGVPVADAVALNAADLLVEMNAGQLFADEGHVADVAAGVGTERVMLLFLRSWGVRVVPISSHPASPDDSDRRESHSYQQTEPHTVSH
jgi:hypothetical protein